MDLSSEHWIAEWTSAGNLAAFATALLLLLSLVVLPHRDRRELRIPTVCLVVHFLLVGLETAGLVPNHLSRTASAAALLLLLIALSRVGFLLIVDWLIGKRLARPLPRIFRDILQGVLFLVAALVVFRILGVDLGSILTTSAILTAVIGLSLQETLGNLFAGLAVHAESPFEVGDWVDIGESDPILGQVMEINWRATKLQTPDGVAIMVPNGLIARSCIRNYQRPSTKSRFTVSVQGPYEAPPNLVERVILDCLKECPGILKDPKAKVWVSDFADSGVEYQIAYYLEHRDRGFRRDIESSIRTRVWYAFSRAKISIPFPIRDVRHHAVEPMDLKTGVEIAPTTKVEILSRVDLFEPLPPEVIEQLAIHAVAQLFAEGEDIVRQGESGTEFFVVAAGEVSVILTCGAQPSTEIARMGIGQAFGEFSMVTGVRKATVRALVETVVLRIEFGALRDVIGQTPGLAKALTDRIVERQRTTESVAGVSEQDAVTAETVRGVWLNRLRRMFS